MHRQIIEAYTRVPPTKRSVDVERHAERMERFLGDTFVLSPLWHERAKPLAIGVALFGLVPVPEFAVAALLGGSVWAWGTESPRAALVRDYTTIVDELDRYTNDSTK